MTLVTVMPPFVDEEFVAFLQVDSERDSISKTTIVGHRQKDVDKLVPFVSVMNVCFA